MHRLRHNLVQATVHDGSLVCSLHVEFVDLFTREAEDFEQARHRFLLVLLGHATGRNVINVLQPFEVGAGHTAAVHQKIRSNDNAASSQDLLCTERRRPVSTLKNHLALETAGVFLVD